MVTTNTNFPLVHRIHNPTHRPRAGHTDAAQVREAWSQARRRCGANRSSIHRHHPGVAAGSRGSSCRRCAMVAEMPFLRALIRNWQWLIVIAAAAYIAAIIFTAPH